MTVDTVKYDNHLTVSAELSVKIVLCAKLSTSSLFVILQDIFAQIM